MLLTFPVQQYLSCLSTLHALLQPPGTVSFSEHCDVMFAAQRGPLLHACPLCLFADVGMKSMGTLKPSTREMSKKSVPPPMVNSASVAGG